MLTQSDAELFALKRRKEALRVAVTKKCSAKWILRQWGRFIKQRDLYRCVCCKSETNIQAHHVVRKTLYPLGFAELGNGITLCKECHYRVHEKSNGPVDYSAPLGDADDQDEWSFLFGLLLDDATGRGLEQDEFYFIADHMLEFFHKIQGYEDLLGAVLCGSISRIRFAHEIMRVMPEIFYTNFASELVRLNIKC